MATRALFDRDEATGLLRQLVAIRSYPGEELAVQQAIAAWLRANSLTPEFQPTANGQPNVLARVSNGPGPTLLLNGHVDTVLAVDGWPCDPWQGRLDGDMFSALGAADMKAGVVVTMLVARALAQQLDGWQGTLLFSSVTDEEAYSHGARALVAAGVRADACIVTEPCHQEAIIGGPGKLLVNIDAVGKAAHGFMPWEGVNAAIELARFVAGLLAGVPVGTHQRMTASQTILSFQSGSAQYVITLPEQARAVLTRQIVPGETAETVLAQLRAYAETLDSPASFAFSVAPPYYPPYLFDAPDHALTRAFAAASAAVLDAPIPLGTIIGITDGNLLCGEAGIPTIVYGPRGGAFHQNSEWVDLSTLAPCAQVIYETALRVLCGPTSAR